MRIPILLLFNSPMLLEASLKIKDSLGLCRLVSPPIAFNLILSLLDFIRQEYKLFFHVYFGNLNTHVSRSTTAMPKGLPCKSVELSDLFVEFEHQNFSSLSRQQINAPFFS